MRSKIFQLLINLKLSINKLNYTFQKTDNNKIQELKHISIYLKGLLDNLEIKNSNKKIFNEKLCNEINKSFIKAHLSYLNFSFISAFKLAKKFSVNNNINSKNIFFTPNYYMIHLPDDGVEEGNMHIDQDGNKNHYTLWTPLVDYDYPALSYFSYGYLAYKFLKIILRNNVNKIIKLINVKNFQTLIWAGLFVHKGNKNISKKFSAASVVWISIGLKKKSNISYNLKKFEESNKYKFDDYLTIDENYEILQSELNLLVLEIEEIFQYLDLGLIEILNILYKKYISNNNITKHKKSFFYSILSQRINTMIYRNTFINIQKEYKLLLILDIISVANGVQSYSSFIRLVNNQNIGEKELELIYKFFIKLKIFKNLTEIDVFIKKGYQ